MILAGAPSPLWYVTRGAGAVTLVLLTVSVVLGIVEVRRLQPAGTPRFAYASLHRSVSLLAILLLTVHVVTLLLDPFPAFAITTVFIPFSGNYRPLWVGFGAIASDLLLSLILTSLVRRRLGLRAWRAVHWAAYVCWPVALMHGVGTGSDSQVGWMMVLTGVCVLAVLTALALRLQAPGTPAGLRAGVLAGALLTTVAFGVWARQGPLADGWARRSGTPASVLAAFRPRTVTVPAVTPARAVPAPPRAFAGTLSGSLRQGVSAGGATVLDLRLRVHDGPSRRVRLRISGQSVDGGGVSMERSAVTFGPPSRPREYQGRIQSLQNGRIDTLVGAADGRAFRLRMVLSVAENQAVTGQIDGEPVT